MKKKIISFVLAICLIIPGVMLAGCGNKGGSGNSTPPVTDTRVWYDVGNFKMAFEGVNIAGSSLTVYVEVKNPKSYEITLNKSDFLLRWNGKQGGMEPLSLALQSSTGNWIDYSSIDCGTNGQAMVKIIFYGTSSDSSKVYSLEYLGEKIAEITSAGINVMLNN